MLIDIIAYIGATKIHWINETHTQYPQKINVWAGRYWL